VRLVLLAHSLRSQQRISLALGTRSVGMLVVNSDDWQEVTVDVPGGRGAAHLRLAAGPGSEPASLVNPSDQRLLAVAVGPKAVRPLEP
jgi:hypothetical protein